MMVLVVLMVVVKMVVVKMVVIEVVVVGILLVVLIVEMEDSGDRVLGDDLKLFIVENYFHTKVPSLNW